MLLTFLGGKDGGLPAGMAEFTNDGKFIRRIDQPKDAPYGYDLAIKPERNRMVTSSFTPMRNYKKPFAKMDLKDFGDRDGRLGLQGAEAPPGRPRRGRAPGGPLVAEAGE